MIHEGEVLGGEGVGTEIGSVAALGNCLMLTEISSSLTEARSQIWTNPMEHPAANIFPFGEHANVLKSPFICATYFCPAVHSSGVTFRSHIAVPILTASSFAPFHSTERMTESNGPTACNCTPLS